MSKAYYNGEAPYLFPLSIILHREGAEEEGEDFVGDAEQDFWSALAQEQKDIQAKEEKRREALMPNQPTPIPEEGGDGDDDDEAGDADVQS